MINIRNVLSSLALVMVITAPCSAFSTVTKEIETQTTENDSQGETQDILHYDSKNDLTVRVVVENTSDRYSEYKKLLNNVTLQQYNTKIEVVPYKNSNLERDVSYYKSSKPLEKPSNFASYPDPYKVEQALRYFYSLLELEGIDPTSLFSQSPLSIKLTDTQFEDAVGHAMRKSSQTEIYMHPRIDADWGWESTYFTLLHEIGHIVWFEFMDETSKSQFKQIRELPNDYKDSHSEWGMRPEEVFAEDFKYIFLSEDYSVSSKAKVTKLTSDQAQKIKSLVLADLRKKTQKFKLTPTHEEAIFFTKQGVIKPNLLLSEIDPYLSEPITLKELVDLNLTSLRGTDKKPLSQDQVKALVQGKSIEEYNSSKPVTLTKIKGVASELEATNLDGGKPQQDIKDASRKSVLSYFKKYFQ